MTVSHVKAGKVTDVLTFTPSLEEAVVRSGTGLQRPPVFGKKQSKDKWFVILRVKRINALKYTLTRT